MLVWQVVLAMTATCGFAVLFNAPPRALPLCATIGGVAFLTRWLLEQAGMSLDLATLLGALLVALLSEWGARQFKAPALVFKVTGFIPFIPGVLAYQTVLHILDGNYLAGLGNGLQTAIRAGAIAGGIGAMTALFRLREQPFQKGHTDAD
jgi:uncharacterized membrane protein YjjB (DUF3815 family)